MKVGEPIDAGDALSSSASILKANPLLFLPQTIILVPELLGIAFPRPLYLELILVAASLVVGVITSGAYPFLVKAVIEHEQFSLASAMLKAYNRFWTLLVASVLVTSIILLGTFLLVVPGIIFLTWYAYTVPVIMLENKGVLDGMTASKAFGRDKKWGTFLIFFIIGIVSLSVSVLGLLFSLGGLSLIGQVAVRILYVPVTAWISVVLSYTYLSYGPAAVAVGSEIGIPLSRSGHPGATNRFCTYCGTPKEPDAQFCSKCGNAL